MFDAYTVKKVLPRLFAAVILIQLSWFLFTGMIQITNMVAYGIEGLIYMPFGGYQNLSLENILSGMAGGSQLGAFSAIAAGVGVGIGVLAVGGVLATAAIALLGILIAVALLLFRQVAIVALLLIAPIALVAWILPGTEKWWKMWWESFSKLLILYPIILGFLAVGRALAAITVGVNPDTGAFQAIDSLLMFLIVIACIFGPFYLIPKTFQLAGGVFQTLTGTINNTAKGGFDRLKNRRKQTMAKNWEATQSGIRFKGGDDTNFRGRLNRGIQRGAMINKAGLRPSLMRGNLDSAVSDRNRLMRDKIMEDEDYSWKHNDGLNMAVAATNNAAELRNYLQEHGDYTSDVALEADVSRVERMRRKHGSDALRQRAWIQAMAGGTAYEGVDGWAAAALVTHGDDAALTDLVAEGRKVTMSAGRVDQGGAGFGDTLNVARAFAADPNANMDEQSSLLHRAVLRSQGPGVITHSSMKPRAIQELMPEMRERVQTAYASGNQDHIDRELATVASIYDSLAASSPQNAEVFAEGLMRWDPTSPAPAGAQNLTPGAAGPTVPIQNTLRERIEDRRAANSDVFLSTRRELNATAVAQGAVGGGAQGNNPAPVDPTANQF